MRLLSTYVADDFCIYAVCFFIDLLSLSPRSVRSGRSSRPSGISDDDHSFLPKRKLADLATTPNSRSSGGADVDGFFASGSSPEYSSGGVSGGYKARDARAGGGAALTPVVKRRAILYDRSPHENNHHTAALNISDPSFVDTEAAAAAAASALLAVRSSDGPKRSVHA